MIQPIGAFSPRAEFRGHGVKSQTPQQKSKAEVALINAGGLSVLAGAFTTAVARNYTSSWAHAFVLGVGGFILSLFFMFPSIAENSNLLGGKKKHDMSAISKDGVKTSSVVKNNLRPAKKLVQFRQS